MSIQRVASSDGFRCRLTHAAFAAYELIRSGIGLLPVLLGLLLAAPVAVRSAPAFAAEPAGEGDQLIVTLRANGVDRGEFTVVRTATGEFLISAADLAKLQIQPREQARREVAGDTWYAARSLGATSLSFNEAELALEIDFRADALPGTRIDLSSRPPPVPASPVVNSLVLSYRLSAHRDSQRKTQAAMDNDLNVHVGGLLLRQETRFDSAPERKGLRRGQTQVIWDDRNNARRWMAGDVLSSAGAFGSAITGGGFLLQKLYTLTPDLIRQPTASLHASTTLPAQVEVSVDGSTIYRADVGPGPITLDNLLLNGGTRNVRVVVTDASGRRQVVEQPFLFTDSVLAKGFHEYSYFLGKRSELDLSSRWRYKEGAWQGYHRYGVNDSLTVSGGGEGNRDFHNIGGGITLRSDRAGLLSVDLLRSADRVKSSSANGWSARYTYASPVGAVVVGRRQYERGFRSFGEGALSLFPLNETRIGASATFWQMNVSADFVRTVDAAEKRDTAFLRLSTNLGRGVTLFAEYQTTRVNSRPGWAANVYLRKELETFNWVASTVKAGPQNRGVAVEAGRQLMQGEGFGYRVGASAERLDSQSTRSSFVAADWNLRPASVGLYASSALGSAGGTFVQANVSGALVALDGYWGATRQVTDGFALAKLGVPQSGVELYLNNQPQGRTDAQGRLFIPQVSSLGRQELSLNDKDLSIEYNIPQKRHTIAPAYRSGTVVDFGVRKVRAIAGTAWQLRGSERAPIAARQWMLAGAGASLTIETGSAGDFYVEDAPPGTYTGTVQIEGRSYACRATVPDFPEPVHELKEGVICE